MSAEQLLGLLVGGAMLVIVGVDVYSAVLHHWGSAGPIAGRFAGWVWAVAVRSTARLGRDRRRRLLGQIGPLLVPVIIVAWAVWIIVAFAIIYWPWIVQNFGADTSVPHPIGFFDALHFSGVSFFTIGYGDLVPVTTGMRMIGVLQGGAGFAFVTLAISYFISLYGGYYQQRTAAESLYFQAAMSADAARLVASHAPTGSMLVDEVSRLRDSLAAIRASFLNYPILHYFISKRPEQSLVRLLFVAQDLRTLLDTAIDPGRRPDLAELGTRSGLLHAVAAVQSGVVETMVRHQPYAPEPPTPAAEEAWARRFARARDLLRDAGIAVREDDTAVRDYCRARAEWEPVLRTNAAAVGEDWNDVVDGM